MLKGFKVIHTYTRQQAIADGELIDSTPLAREAGYCFPVAISRSIWNTVVRPSDRVRKERGQSEKGRMWDILWMLKLAIPKTRENIVRFSVLIDDDPSWTCHLKAICGPGDSDEPVVTILFPDED